MKVHFRTYCQGCRYAVPRGSTPVRSRCVWRRRGHRFDWEFWIEHGGIRLIQRQGFSSQEKARQSAERAWFKLVETIPCVEQSAGAA